MVIGAPMIEIVHLLLLVNVGAGLSLVDCIHRNGNDASLQLLLDLRRHRILFAVVPRHVFFVGNVVCLSAAALQQRLFGSVVCLSAAALQQLIILFSFLRWLFVGISLASNEWLQAIQSFSKIIFQIIILHGIF